MAKFRVTLTEEERSVLRQMVSSGKGAARTLLHGRILLQADASPEGMQYTDEAIAEALSVSLSTIHRVRQQFVEESFEAALAPRQPLKRPDKVTITGEVEQQLIALACGEPPPGHGRWTVRLLADRLVELGYVARASRETVRQALKTLVQHRMLTRQERTGDTTLYLLTPVSQWQPPAPIRSLTGWQKAPRSWASLCRCSG